MQKLDLDNKFNTRSNGGYIPYTNFGVDFKHSFFPYFSSLWNSLPKIAKCKDLIEFKLFTNQEIKPSRFRHFARGNKLSNSLLTQIRVGRSDLNQHKFSIGFSESPECKCHFREESPSHFFLDCFLY